MDIVLRSAAVFTFIYLLTRVIGRRELSQLQPFDIILLVVIGDLIAQGVTQSDNSVTGAFLATATFALLAMLLSYLAFRFRRLRPLLEGEPIVVVHDGKVIDENLRRERITIEDVLEEARRQGIASLDEVHWGVLETSGSISFLCR